MVNIFIYVAFTAIMIYGIYVLYLDWDLEYKRKQKRAKRPKAGPVKKAEYDCTENFYHD